MNKYFIGSHEWTEKDKNFKGLPRPFKNFDKNIYKNIKSTLAKKIPIPWQSEPVFEDFNNISVFSVILKNESMVYLKSLCSYCGIKINKNEICVRWNASDLKIPKEINERVKSDYHPLHLECMKQARIFCPFMKKINEEEFVYGPYEKLKKESKNFINFQAKKDIQ